LQRFLKVMNDTYHLGIRDRELACAPFYSPEGQEYFAAMQCGVNMAFCNRQMILHGIREVFSDVFGRSEGEATFFTTAHGSGRIMGRRRGIYVRAVSNSGLAEEAGGAYKSIDAVVDAADRAGLSRKVVRLTPVGNIKG
jgi:RNA-splicing ligase RtcB